MSKRYTGAGSWYKRIVRSHKRYINYEQQTKDKTRVSRAEIDSTEKIEKQDAKTVYKRVVVTLQQQYQ